MKSLHRKHRLLFKLGAFTALCAALAWIYAESGPGLDPGLGLRQAQESPPKPPPAIQATAGTPTSAGGASSASPRVAESLPSASTMMEPARSASPLSAIMALRGQRLPGSLARAEWVELQCRVAFMSRAQDQDGKWFSDFKSQPGEVFPMPGLDANMQAARVAAAQEVMARCHPVGQADLAGQLGRDRPDDKYGLDFRNASREAGQSPVFPRAALQRLAAQGALYWLAPALMAIPERPRDPPRFFEDKPLGGMSSPDAYNKALWTAAEAAAELAPGSQGSHLSSLANCIQTGVCGGEFGTQHVAHLPADSKVRAEVLAVYPRMAEAMRRGDVEAFAPPPEAAAKKITAP